MRTTFGRVERCNNGLASAPGRAGFTLVEMLIVCVLLGAVSAFGMLRLRTTLRDAQVRHARTAMTQLLNATRAAAIRTGQPAQLRVVGGTRVVGALGTGGTRPFDSLELAAVYQVHLTPSHAVIAYDARGLANGTASQVFIFTHALGATDSLCVSPLGLARRRGCTS